MTLLSRLRARSERRRTAARESAVELDITLADLNATWDRLHGPIPARWVGPSRAQVRAAITTTARLGAADLALPGVVERLTDAVMATFPPDSVCDALRADLAADPAVWEQYADRFAGEHGDVDAMRRGVTS